METHVTYTETLLYPCYSELSFYCAFANNQRHVFH